MELRPADLGDDFAATIITRRAAGRHGGFHAWLFRVFRAKTGLTQRTVEDTLRRIVTTTPNSQAWTPAFYFVGAFCWFLFRALEEVNRFASQNDFAVWIATYWAFQLIIYLPFAWFIYVSPLRRAFTAPITYEEAYTLYQVQTEPSLKEFAWLVCDLVKADDLAPAAVPALRDALKLLGNAGHRLVTETLTIQTSAETLYQKMATARRDAEREADPVTQAALLQQADAHEKAARATEERVRQARRIAALKAALSAQIEALRLELPALRVGAETGDLAAMVEAVRTVSEQASNTASARAELDAAPHTLTVRR